MKKFIGIDVDNFTLSFLKSFESNPLSAKTDD
jgi:hypothetical protein